jgi:hypothetical protein
MLKMLYGVDGITISKETLLHLCKIGFNNKEGKDLLLL